MPFYSQTALFLCASGGAQPQLAETSPARLCCAALQDAMALPDVAERMAKAYIPPEIDLEENSKQPIIAIQSEQLPWIVQFKTLLRRAFREKWRQRYAIFITFAQCCIIGVMFSTAFRPLTATNRRRVACVPLPPPPSRLSLH